MNLGSLNIGSGCDTLVVVDDTLVVAADPYRAETHMRCMNATGMNYGLRLKWKNARYYQSAAKLTSQPLTETFFMQKMNLILTKLFGCMWHGWSGNLQRIGGKAKGQFDKLAKVWRLFTPRTQQKVRIFQACVVSKLLYCLHRMWLKKTELETYCFFVKGLVHWEETAQNYGKNSLSLSLRFACRKGSPL